MHKKNVIEPLIATKNQFNLNITTTLQYSSPYNTLFLINEQIFTYECCINQFQFQRNEVNSIKANTMHIVVIIYLKMFE